MLSNKYCKIINTSLGQKFYETVVLTVMAASKNIVCLQDTRSNKYWIKTLKKRLFQRTRRRGGRMKNCSSSVNFNTKTFKEFTIVSNTSPMLSCKISSNSWNKVIKSNNLLENKGLILSKKYFKKKQLIIVLHSG